MVETFPKPVYVLFKVVHAFIEHGSSCYSERLIAKGAFSSYGNAHDYAVSEDGGKSYDDPFATLVMPLSKGEEPERRQLRTHKIMLMFLNMPADGVEFVHDERT